MAIKNGTEVTFTRAGKKLSGTLERKSKPEGIGKGKYERGIIKLADGSKVTMPTSAMTAK